MSWGLAQLHVALDDRLEYQVAEVSPHLVSHLIGQAQTSVIHGQQESLYLEFLIQA